MNIVPPHHIGSVLQSPAGQQQQSRVQDAEANRRAAAARELAALEQQQTDAIEDTDADTRVHADSGGQGSRGRAFEERMDAGDEDERAAPEGESAGGGLHLDITV